MKKLVAFIVDIADKASFVKNQMYCPVGTLVAAQAINDDDLADKATMRELGECLGLALWRGHGTEKNEKP